MRRRFGASLNHLQMANESAAASKTESFENGFGRAGASVSDLHSLDPRQITPPPASRYNYTRYPTEET